MASLYCCNPSSLRPAVYTGRTEICVRDVIVFGHGEGLGKDGDAAAPLPVCCHASQALTAITAAAVDAIDDCSPLDGKWNRQAFANVAASCTQRMKSPQRHVSVAISSRHLSDLDHAGDRQQNDDEPTPTH